MEIPESRMKLTVVQGKLFFNGQEISPSRVEAALGEFITDQRRDRIESVLAGRTTGIATVVEGSINTGNVSAIMRTAEAFGFLPFHVIRTESKFKNSARSSQGSDKWLDLHLWDSSVECIAFLKKTDYQIVATSLDERATPISTVDFSRRSAIIVGNEADGISNTVLKAADVVCQIPMSGFVESFNVSVAAALCLYHAQLSQSRKDGTGNVGSVHSLTAEELQMWRIRYYYRSVRRSDDIIERMLDDE